MRTPYRDGHPCTSTDQSQEEAFNKELLHNSKAARADREANGDLPLTGARTSQKEIRDVCASDEQHETDNRHQHPQRTAQLTTEIRPSLTGRTHFDGVLQKSCLEIGRRPREPRLLYL